MVFITIISIYTVISVILLVFQKNEPDYITEWRMPKETHTIKENPYLELVWQREIFTPDSSPGDTCTVKNGHLFVLGSETQIGNQQLIAINDLDGTTLWTIDNVSGFSMGENQLFLDNGKKVFSVSINDGSENWARIILLARNINRTLFYKEQLFVSASGHPFFILDPETGQILKTYSSVEVFRTENQNIPIYSDTSEPFNPIFIRNDLIRVQGSFSFSIERFNIEQKTIKWEIKSDSISNAALISDKLFYISNEDKIIAIDVDSGEELFSVGIEPTIGFMDYEKGTQHDGYFVCSDDENNLLFVILGDSRQLFAFSVK